jgi:PncC family amidohydrolase
MTQAIQDRLVARGETVATAESITGGQLAARLTQLPGSSFSYVGGVVAYATRTKESVLGVPAAVVADSGVVSAECAVAMATGVRDLMGSTYGVSTTGVAGPERQDGLPPGTVWICVAGPDGAWPSRLELSGDRSTIQGATCDAALSALGAILRREEPGLG